MSIGIDIGLSTVKIVEIVKNGNKYFVENLNNRIVYSYFFLIGYFLILNIFHGGNFLDLYIYKSRTDVMSLFEVLQRCVSTQR